MFKHYPKYNMNVNYIKQRIKDEIDYNIIDSLKDENMINEYIKSKSVKIKIEKLKNVLKTTLPNLSNLERDNFIKEYTKEIIPPGTKGVLKGNKFNEYIKYIIIENISKYEIKFEQMSPYLKTSEIPDWTIHNPINNKTIIGMNQLTLWGGGHQTNRASKYVINNFQNTEYVKFINVVCNEVNVKTQNSKIYLLFSKGYTENTLCFPGALIKHIIDFLQ